MQETLWKIWSIEHNAWWSTSYRGYTTDRKDAGVYSYEDACDIVRRANEFRISAESPNEAMVEAIECYKKI